MGSVAPVGEMLSRARRAKRTGSRLHLDQSHIDIIFNSDVYALLTSLEAREILASCQKDEAPQTASSSEGSGYGIVPTATIGPSAGLKVVGQAANQQALAAAATLIRRKRHSRP